ncbi:MAG TPA: hypothetical protein VF094_08825 [Gaiellaceae bacterium]
MLLRAVRRFDAALSVPVAGINESPRDTTVYEDSEYRWIIASVRGVSGASNQGRTRAGGASQRDRRIVWNPRAALFRVAGTSA